MSKYVYVLEHYLAERPTIIGVFSSLRNARKLLMKLPKKHQYTIYRLPLNAKVTKGKAMEDEWTAFDHWHYGTYDVSLERCDEEGNALSTEEYTEVRWPDENSKYRDHM